MTEQPLDLRWMSRALRRRKYFVLVMVVIGVGVGLLVTAQQTPKYVARSVVLLPSVGNDTKGNSLRDMIAEIQVAQSTEVLKNAQSSLAPRTRVSFQSILNQVSVRSLSGNLLEFSGHDNSPQKAALLANAVAGAYVSFANGAGQGTTPPGQLQSESVDLSARIRSIGSDIAGDSADLAKLDPTSTDAIKLSASIDALRTELTTANSQLADVTSRLMDQVSRQGTRQLQTALPPSHPSQLPAIDYVAGGGLAGLLAGILLALIREKRDHRVRVRDEIAEIVGVPVLASLEVPSRHRVVIRRILSPDWEQTATEKLALRRALSALDVTAGRGPTDLVIVAPGGDHTAPIVALEIAVFAARMGIDTSFVVGSRHNDLKTLRAACRSVPREGAGAIPNFRAYDVAGDTGLEDQLAGVPLTVTLLVSDGDTVEFPARGERIVTALATSSRTSTEDQLARAAVVCLDAGHPLSGVLLANPDPEDHTTGWAPWRVPSENGASSAGVPVGSSVGTLQIHQS